MNAPDVVVVGLGVHGAALLHELARRGVSVVGLEAGPVPNGNGSTTGRTRITREAYYEHPAYVPLVQRATELWAELEELTGAALLRRTGGLMAGAPDGTLVQGALASARTHDLPHEVLDSAGIARRFPSILPPPHTVGVYEPNAGVLMVDACMRTLLDQARASGAELHDHTRVTGWQANPAAVTLYTDTQEVRARQVVFTAGAWLNRLLATERERTPVQLRLEVERQTTHWFEPAPGTFLRASVCPITMLEREDGSLLYTLPDVGHGVKAGLHHGGDIVDPDDVDRTIRMDEQERVRSALEEWMPGATHRFLDDDVCLYTNTPDLHFAIGTHPGHVNVTIVSACSGHGFKFAPAIAEAVADRIIEGAAVFDLSLFDLARVVQ